MLPERGCYALKRTNQRPYSCKFKASLAPVGQWCFKLIVFCQQRANSGSGGQCSSHHFPSNNQFLFHNCTRVVVVARTQGTLIVLKGFQLPVRDIGCALMPTADGSIRSSGHKQGTDANFSRLYFNLVYPTTSDQAVDAESSDRISQSSSPWRSSSSAP